MNQPIRILYVDDYPLDRELVRDSLEKENGGFELVESASRPDFETKLAQGGFDLILSDFNILGFEGLQVLETVRLAGLHTPVIIVTGTGSEEVAAETIKRGAADYVLKSPKHIRRLPHTIHAVLEKERLEGERRQAIEALRDSEWRNRMITELTTDYVFVVDVAPGGSLKLRWASDSMQRLTGRTIAEAATPDLWKEIIHPDDVSIFFDFINHLLSSGESGVIEIRTFAKSGPQRWIRIHAQPVKDEGGIITLILGAIADITGRKQAEQELRKSEDKYRHLVETSNEAILVAQDGMLKFVNRMACEMTGYSEQELTSKPFPEFIHPADRDMVVKNYLQRLKGDIVQPRYSFRLIAKDGSTKWVEIGAVLIDWEGKPATLNFLSDITERKQVEEALLESEDKFKYVFDHSVAGKSFTLPSGELNVNQAFCDMLGYSADELKHRKWQEITHPEDVELTQNANNAMISGEKESMRFIKRFFHKNGSIVWADVATTLRRDKDGQPLYFMTTFLDITERKRAEEQIRHLNTRLELQIEARTSELREAQEQLVRKEKLAVLGQLAGSVGHELRNPLGVISTSIYYLKLVQSDANEKIKQHHAMIDQEVHNAEKIISDLLDYARFVSVEREIVPVPKLVQSVLSRFPAPVSVEVALELPGDLPKVFADPRQMEQVLGNLIVNAFQAMGDGGKMTISARVEKNMVAIAVKDTGAGISPENMKKLFEPLFTTKAKGIGLGLAVSKKLTEANSGRIEVYSDPGKGSTFTLYLSAYNG